MDKNEKKIFLISQCLIYEFSFFVVSWTKIENLFINPSSFDGYYLVPSVLFTPHQDSRIRRLSLQLTSDS